MAKLAYIFCARSINLTIPGIVEAMANVPNLVAGMPSHQAIPAVHSSSESADPVTKFKVLVPHLKESLQKVMANAATIFAQNSQFDSGQKTAGAPIQRFDRSLEEFYAICDQIELNLKLALEVVGVNADTQRNIQLQVAGGQMKYAPAGPTAASSDLQTYTQFQSIVKVQVTAAKEIHDALLDCLRRMSDSKQIQPPS